MIKYVKHALSSMYFIKQIDLFAIEISNTEPNFTAMDLFDVDLKLIPKVTNSMKLKVTILKLNLSIKQMNAWMRKTVYHCPVIQNIHTSC